MSTAPAGLVALLAAPDEPRLVLETLAAWPDAAIVAGASGHAAVVGPFFERLSLAELRRHGRVCQALARSFTELDRVVRVVELTTDGFLKGVDSRRALEACYFAAGLSAEALNYLRDFDAGRNWRNLTALVPPTVFATAADEMRRTSESARTTGRVVDARGVVVHLDPTRGLVHATAEGVDFEGATLGFGNLELAAGRLTFEGCTIDAFFDPPCARAATEPARLAWRAKRVTAHEVTLRWAAQMVSVAALELPGLVFSASELPLDRGMLEEGVLALSALLPTDGGEPPTSSAAGGPVAVALLNMVLDALAASACGPLLAGPGGVRLSCAGLVCEGVVAAGVSIERVEARRLVGGLDRLATSGPRADADRFTELYAAERLAPFAGPALDQLLTLRDSLEAALTLELQQVNLRNARFTAPAKFTELQMAPNFGAPPTSLTEAYRGYDAGKTRKAPPESGARSRSVNANGAVSSDGELSAGIDVQSVELTTRTSHVGRLHASAAAEVSRRLLSMAGRMPPPVVRGGTGRLAVSGVTWVGAGRVGPAAVRGNFTCKSARVERSEGGEWRVAMADGQSAGLVLSAGEAEVELARLGAVTLDATLAGGRVTFAIAAGQALVGRLAARGWAVHGGLTIGGAAVRGTGRIAGARGDIDKIDEARCVRCEARGLVWRDARTGRTTTIGRGVADELRARGFDGALGRFAGWQATRLTVPELELLGDGGSRARLDMTARAVEVAVAADGALSGTVTAVSASGSAELRTVGEGGEAGAGIAFVARGRAGAESLRVGGRVGEMALAAVSASFDFVLDAARGADNAHFDLKGAFRGPSALVGKGTVRGHIESGDLSLGVRAVTGAGSVLGCTLDMRGFVVRVEAARGVLGVSTLVAPKVTGKDLRVRAGPHEIASAEILLNDTKLERLEIAAGGARAGFVSVGAAVLTRARVAIDGAFDGSGGALRLKDLGVRLGAEPAWQIDRLALEQFRWQRGVIALEMPALELVSVGFDGRRLTAAEGSFALARPSAAGMAPSQPLTLVLPFFDRLQGEIALAIPLGERTDRVVGALQVEGARVRLGPSFADIRPPLEQYWGWAPRWLVARALGDVVERLAVAFEHELVGSRRAFEGALIGADATASSATLDPTALTREIGDVLGRWAAALDAVGARAREDIPADPIEGLWKRGGEGGERGAASVAETAWIQAIAVAVGLQGTGVSEVRDGAEGRLVAGARVGARVAGQGTVGSGVSLELSANLSHAFVALGWLRLQVARASIDGRRQGTLAGLSLGAFE